MDKILKIGSGKLFLIFIGMYSNFYDSNNLTVGDISLIIRMASYCIYHLWLYTILSKSYDRILEYVEIQNFTPFNQYKLGLGISIIAMFLMSIGSQQVSYNSLSLQIIYSEPVEYAIMYLIGMLLLISITAKSLVMVERKREIEFKDYIKSMLLLLFPFIGVWFIQPKIQKLYLK
jgi:hypothetical protein